MSILNKHQEECAPKRESQNDLLLGDVLENKNKICPRKDYKTAYSNVNYTLLSSKNACAILKTIQELLEFP